MPSYFVEFILTDNNPNATGILKLDDNLQLYGTLGHGLGLRTGIFSRETVGHVPFHM